MEPVILNQYRQKAALAGEEADKFKKLSEKYSLLRLFLFAAFLIALYTGITLNEVSLVIASVIALLIIFAWLVKRQSGYDASKNYYLDLKTVTDNEINSVQSQLNIYNNGAEFADDKHYYTSDLDIFGPFSLFQLINRAATYPGMQLLANWLAAPANKEVILLRQASVKEISVKPDWKLNFQSYLLFSIKQDKNQISNLLRYLNIPVEMDGSSLLNTYCTVAPYLMAALIILSIYFAPARYVVALVMVYNNRLVSSKSAEIDKTDLIAGKISTSMEHFVFAFKAIENEEWKSAYLNGMASKIKGKGGQSVSKTAEKLARLIHKLNYRSNMITKFIMNIFYIWDIRQVIGIEKWKLDNKESLKNAFDILACFEAIISLSAPAINYTDWCMPEIIDNGTYTLTARSIAHPLLKNNNRIANNYTLSDTFKIDIITGSNMAGKSTFLRTLGINSVLALCGGPVCAAAMQVSVMTVITYMRIKDSLNESTSTFKAELYRLQMLLKTVEKEKVFFLIDEMLRGTNSADKYLGSKAVIEQLVRKKAVGIVATHDLQIAELEEMHPDYVRNFYFDIQVVNGEMLFDYTIKEGECKTFNASILLKQIGIDIN